MEDIFLSSTALWAILLTLCVCVFVRRFLSAKKEPPGPGVLLLLHDLLLKNKKSPETTLHELSKKYGSVFTIYFGLQKAVVITGWKTIKAVLNNNVFSDAVNLPIIHDMKLNHGIVFVNGPAWKEMKQFSLTNLKRFGMGTNAGEEKIMKETQYLLEVMEKTQGKAFDTTECVSYAVSNVICSTIFGHRYEYDDPEFRVLLERFHKHTHLLGSPSIQLYNRFPKLFSQSKERMQLIEGSFENQKHLWKIIKAEEETLEPHMCRGLVDSFLLRKKQLEAAGNMNSHYHEDNLRVSTLNLFAGGTETTSATLRYGLLIMAKYPEIQDKVQEELDRVIGSRVIRSEDRKSLPFTQAVINETQRLLSVIPMLPHATTQDVILQGYHIKKGTQVLIALTSALHDEAEWETPHSFNPAHFLNKDGNLITRAAFFPFGQGARRCVGESLAKIELFIFFASLLQHFRFTPPPGVTREDLDLKSIAGIANIPSPHKLCAVKRI